MRIATYNVEWFNSLFADDNRLLPDDGWSGRRDVTRAQQIDALKVVFATLDADAIMVVEAPDQGRTGKTVAALEHFAAQAGLRARKAIMGFANDTQQELALLFDPDTISAHHDPKGAPDARAEPRFDGIFQIDLDVDATEDTVRFSKPPLELAIETAQGTQLRMIGAHLKSKAPHGARNRDEVIRISIANRRKQLAQAIWLRRRIETHLKAGDNLILLGDLNDGPGLDEYENLFGRSSVEILMGPELYDPHARQALSRSLSAAPTTARFALPGGERFLQALLDYIMVTPDLRAKDAKWRIWHPFDDVACWQKPGLRDALLTASDHFPVTMDLDI